MSNTEEPMIFLICGCNFESNSVIMLKCLFLDVTISCLRYYVKCKLNPKDRQRLRDSLNNGSLGSGTVFHEGMQTALREGTVDDDGVVHFIEVCYCLEYGLYPMAMEIPELQIIWGCCWGKRRTLEKPLHNGVWVLRLHKEREVAGQVLG